MINQAVVAPFRLSSVLARRRLTSSGAAALIALVASAACSGSSDYDTGSPASQGAVPLGDMPVPDVGSSPLPEGQTDAVNTAAEGDGTAVVQTAPGETAADTAVTNPPDTAAVDSSTASSDPVVVDMVDTATQGGQSVVSGDDGAAVAMPVTGADDGAEAPADGAVVDPAATAAPSDVTETTQMPGAGMNGPNGMVMGGMPPVDSGNGGGAPDGVQVEEPPVAAEATALSDVLAASDDAECVEYCSILGEWCLDRNAQYADDAECLAACTDMGHGARGPSGDTIACRLWHVTSNVVDKEPGGNIHCSHAGPSSAGLCTDG